MRDRIDHYRATVPYKYVVAIVFTAGVFIELLDSTIVNVALPTLGRDFHVGTASIEWLVTGYLLSLAVWIPASGWIGDRYGTKKTFLFAIAMFTFASALCGQATSLGELVAFRLLQGLGGGMLTPVGTAMLFRAFPPAERARASTVLLIPTVIAPATGPVIGGLLVDRASWRWIFYVNLPIGVAAFIFGLLFLREHREPTAGRFDIFGFVLSGGGLALVLYSLSQGPRSGWTSPVVALTMAGGVGAFTLLAVVELRIKDPMLDLRLLSDRLFRNANILSLSTYASFVAVIFLLPLYLQDLRGLSALQSGLATFPQAIGVMIASQFVGRLYPRVGPRRLIAIGVGSAALVIFSLATLGIDTNLWVVRGLVFLRGVSGAFVFVPLQAATYATISLADTGRASSIYSTVRQVGSALGVAVLATVLASRTKTHVHALVNATPQAVRNATASAFKESFITAGAIALVGAFSALLIHDSDAMSTMRPAGIVLTD